MGFPQNRSALKRGGSFCVPLGVCAKIGIRTFRLVGCHFGIPLKPKKGYLDPQTTKNNMDMPGCFGPQSIFKLEL